MIQPGQFKDYYYSGSQDAHLLWYHVSIRNVKSVLLRLSFIADHSMQDHTDHHTSVDAYFGQNGVHIIYDPAEDALGLPQGKYDIPLVLVDKIYQYNGDLVSPAGETINFFGDIIHVNGQPWPYSSVEPRKYRLRFLYSALLRPFEIYFETEDGFYQPFQVIASDGGLFDAPISTDTLEISMGERYEVVYDFANFTNQNITTGNSMRVQDVNEYSDTDKVMRFVVGNTVTDQSNDDVPPTLRDQATLDQEPANRDQVDRVFNFQRNGGDWTINGVTYEDTNARVIARPQMGAVENWELRWASGPVVHPVHFHLVDFKIKNRTSGRRTVLPYESAGLTDIVLLEPGETVNINAYFGPWNGLYQFHCHNFIHEDHEMMDVFNVTALENLGYNLAGTLSFDDPTDSRFCARDIDQQYYDSECITETLMPDLVGTGAYRDKDQLMKMEKSRGT